MFARHFGTSSPTHHAMKRIGLTLLPRLANLRDREVVVDPGSGGR